MKKLLSLILTLLLLLSAMVFNVGSLNVSAASQYFYIGDVSLGEGEYLLSGKTTTNSYSELEAMNFDFVKGSYAYRHDGEVFLYNFKYNGVGYGESGSRKAAIRSKGIDISLFGENEIICTTAGGVGIYYDGMLVIDTCYEEVEGYSMGDLEITADFPIMIYTTTAYAPQYYQRDGYVTLNVTSEDGVGIALSSETTDVYVDVLSGFLYIEGNNSRSGIEGIVPDDKTIEFESDFADIIIAGCKKGIVVDYANIWGSMIIIYADEYGIDAINGKVEMSDAYVDITVEEKWGCSIRGSLVTMDGGTMIRDFGSVSERVFVAYPRTYIRIGDFYLYDGEYLGSSGYKTTSTIPPDGYAYFTVSSGVGRLELNNFRTSDMCEAPRQRDDYFKDSACIYSMYDLEIVLKGENSLEPEDGCYGIIAYGSLTINGEGTLNIGKAMQSRYDSYDAFGIYLYSDYYTSDVELTLNSGNVNIYSNYGVTFFNLTKGLENTFTVNGGKHRCGDVNYELYHSKGNFIMNDGEFKLLSSMHNSLTIDSGNVGSGFRQNGGRFEIEVVENYHGAAVQVEIEDQYYVEEGFEIYGGDFSVKSLNGEPVDITNCIRPILGIGVEIVEGDWYSDYIYITQVAIPVDPDMPTSGLLGDVNNDGKIDQYDYLLVKRHYFETRFLTSGEMSRSDVNRDGYVNQFDYILIKRHYFGTYVII